MPLTCAILCNYLYNLISFSSQHSSSKASLSPTLTFQLFPWYPLGWQNSPIQHLWAALTASRIFWTPKFLAPALFAPEAAEAQGLRALWGRLMGHKSNPNMMRHTYARQPEAVCFLILSWRCLHRGRGSSRADMQNSLLTIWACSHQEPPKPRTST